MALFNDGPYTLEQGIGSLHLLSLLVGMVLLTLALWFFCLCLAALHSVLFACDLLHQ